MANKQELLEGINILVDEIRQTQFILSQNSIKKLLRYIVSNPELKYVTDHAKEIYKYGDVYQDAIQGNKSRAFVLPNDPYKVITLVTGILYNIDQNNIEFVPFLKRYFPGSQIPSQYDEFCDYVLNGYARAFASVINQEDSVIEVDNNQNQYVAFPNTFVDQIYHIMVDISDQLIVDSTINESVRRECLQVIEGLYYVIDRGVLAILEPMWVGVKYTLSMSRQYASHIKAMQSILTDYGYIG